MRFAAVAFAVSVCLSGCLASAPTLTEVKIPVAVPCKTTPIERPAFAVDALPLGAGIWDQMKTLRAERKQRQAYEAELEATVKACQ